MPPKFLCWLRKTNTVIYYVGYGKTGGYKGGYNGGYSGGNNGGYSGGNNGGYSGGNPDYYGGGAVYDANGANEDDAGYDED